MSLIGSISSRHIKDLPKLLDCPECGTKIDEYYGFCRPCFNKFTFDGVANTGKPFQIIAPTENRCTYALYGKNHLIQHWFHCDVCDVSIDQGRCLACAVPCRERGHHLQKYYSAFFCDEGYHSILMQRQREKAEKRKHAKCVVM